MSTKILPLFVAMLLVPVSFVFADVTYLNTFIGNFQTTLLPVLVRVLIGLSVLFFIWGLVLFISQSGNEKVREEGKQKMIWGIIALFVIISVWGLVRLLQELTGITPPAASMQRPQVQYTP